MTLGAVLIVKDEAPRIERCLRSAIAAGVTVITVLDTGSTDGTQDVIRRVCEDIRVRIIEEPFVNFGVSRSRAFQLARGSADWLLALDADMAVTIDGPLPDADAGMVEMGTPTFSWRLPLLLRGDLPWQSRGAVHEYTCLENGTLGLRVNTDSVRIERLDSGAPAKTAWQAALLQAEYDTDRTPRTVFYLAQTLAELGEVADARRLYRERAAMGGWVEEVYVATLRAARLEPVWETRANLLLTAWEIRPSRLEALHDIITGLNERGQHHAAYYLSVVPVIPTEDMLFVEPDVWRWGMTFQRSIAAWYIDPDEHDELAWGLLNSRIPDNIRAAIERNLRLRKEAA